MVADLLDDEVEVHADSEKVLGLGVQLVQDTAPNKVFVDLGGNRERCMITPPLSPCVITSPLA